MNTTLDLAPTRTTFSRLAGFGAVGFAVIVAAENLALPSTPDFDASGDEVLRWVHSHHSTIAWVAAAFTVAAACLAMFLGGFVVRAFADDRREVRTAAVTGAVGAIMLGAWFGLVIMSQLVLLGLDGSSSASPATAELLWHLHAAAFAMNFVAIGVALFGVSQAAVRLGLAPSWYRPVGVVGLVCGVAAAMQSASAVDGGSGWQIAFVTFISWLVLLAIVGVNMIRSDS